MICLSLSFVYRLRAGDPASGSTIVSIELRRSTALAVRPVNRCWAGRDVYCRRLLSLLSASSLPVNCSPRPPTVIHCPRSGCSWHRLYSGLFVRLPGDITQVVCPGGGVCVRYMLPLSTVPSRPSCEPFQDVLLLSACMGTLDDTPYSSAWWSQSVRRAVFSLASPLETDSLARAGLSGRPPRLPASSSIDPVLCLHDRRPAGYYDYRRTPMFRRISARHYWVWGSNLVA